MERALIDRYERQMRDLFAAARPEEAAWLTEVAAATQVIRGFGPVKAASVNAYEDVVKALLARKPA